MHSSTVFSIQCRTRRRRDPEICQAKPYSRCRFLRSSASLGHEICADRMNLDPLLVGALRDRGGHEPRCYEGDAVKAAPPGRVDGPPRGKPEAAAWDGSMAAHAARIGRVAATAARWPVSSRRTHRPRKPTTRSLYERHAIHVQPPATVDRSFRLGASASATRSTSGGTRDSTARTHTAWRLTWSSSIGHPNRPTFDELKDLHGQVSSPESEC